MEISLFQLLLLGRKGFLTKREAALKFCLVLILVDNLITSGGKAGKSEKNLFFLENALLFLKNAEAFCLERRGVFGEMPKWFLCECF